MQISTARRAGPKYRFYEAGEKRENSFVSLPKSMIDTSEMEHIEASWSRCVAFGDVAEIINHLVETGVTLIKPALGRVRGNDLERQDGSVFEDNEIVIDELDVKNWKSLVKKFAGKGVLADKAPNAA